MADVTHMAPSEIAEEHATEAHAPYIKVWGALAALTLVEYYYAAWLKDFFLVLLVGLLFWAVIKAGLVGWFFMHLKFEGNWVYMLIVPACILATIFVLALLPDMALKENADEPIVEETSYSLPAPAQPERVLTTCVRIQNGLFRGNGASRTTAALLPLPLGEGRGEGSGIRGNGTSRKAAALLPLPLGEGRGEGSGIS
jgi:cytochrome c oxidase subunit IV